MSVKPFPSDKNVQEIAYDLALSLASKDPEVTTPETLMKKFESLFPECLALVKARRPKDAMSINLDSIR